MPVPELKKAIMELNESLDTKAFSKMVMDEIGKTLDHDQMIGLLTTKLSQMKAQGAEEQKVGDDAISVSQPQNLDDHYERAKQLIDQLRDRMLEIDQRKKSQIDKLKAIQEMQQNPLNENQEEDQDIKQIVDQTNSKISKSQSSLKIRQLIEKELCANIMQMTDIYCKNYLTESIPKTETFQIEEPSVFKPDRWVSYPSQEKLEKGLPNYQLRAIYWQFDDMGNVQDLKFSFGKDYDESDLDVEGMSKLEIQDGTIISRVEYWESSNSIWGIRFLNQNGQEIVMIGRQDTGDKYELQLPHGPIQSIQVGYSNKFSFMTGLKFTYKNFVKVTS